MTIRRCGAGDERAGQTLFDFNSADSAQDIAMKLTIKYFASIREQLHIDEEIVEIDAHEVTVDALRGTARRTRCAQRGSAADGPPGARGRESRDGDGRVRHARG